MNTIFIGAVSLHIPKYICGQYIYEQVNAGTAKWKLWRV